MEENGEIADGNFDFGARMYDGRIGRWWSVDPLSGKYPNLSPYHFSGNNPILFVDYDGRDFGIRINHNTKTITIVSNVYTISENTQRQALAAASHWNNKEFQVNGYSVSFEVNVVAPPQISEEEAISTFDKKFNISGTTNKKKREELIGFAVNKFQRYKAGKLFAEKQWNDFVNNGEEDPSIDNLYEGTSHMKSKALDSYKGAHEAAFTVGGQSIGANFGFDINQNRTDYGNDSRSLGHEIGHTLGLDDKGGNYYSEGGIMQYYVNSSVSQGDVENILRYADDALNGRILKNANVNLLEEVGVPRENSPIKTESGGTQLFELGKR